MAFLPQALLARDRLLSRETFPTARMILWDPQMGVVDVVKEQVCDRSDLGWKLIGRKEKLT